MDEFIPIILFFLFAILSVAGKVLHRKKTLKARTPSGGTRLLAKLKSWLTQLQKFQQYVEMQKEKGADGRSGWNWDQLSDRTPRGLRSQPAPQEERLEDPVMDKDKPPPASVKKRPRLEQVGTRLQQPKKPETAKTEVAHQPLQTVTPAARIRLPGRHADLRRAIVWSEILGPPVALRDTEQK